MPTKFKIIDIKKDPPLILAFFTLATLFLTIMLLSISVKNLYDDIDNVSYTLASVTETQKNFENNFKEELFNDHLVLMDRQKADNELISLKEELESTSLATSSETEEIFTLVDDFERKVERNDKVKIESANIDEKTKEWGALLINQAFEDLKVEISETNNSLDDEYDKYLASLPPPAPVGGGYSYTQVNTEKGLFWVYLIKAPISEYRVKTVSAARGDCSDNCPTKTLAEYVQENGATMGMNGTYFCPPDYSACGGKVNSFDYALYDSNAGKWINKDARTWSDTGMLTFRGNEANFYKKSSEYGGDSVDAAISNYPSLLKDSEIVTKTSILTSYQKDVKGTRGVIGVGGENIYLALIANATVEDAAYVMRALGAKHALNLDGGGSSAMYLNGGYIIGPGRSLPNAIVLIKK